MLLRVAVGLPLRTNSGLRADPCSTGAGAAANANLERRAPYGAASSSAAVVGASTTAAPARSGLGKQFFGAK
jgi:hypothetical protein